MKKAVLIFAMLVVNISFGQMTKNAKQHTFQDGTEVKVGTVIELLTGANPKIDGEFLWVFEGSSQPIPKKHLDKSFSGQNFTVERVLSLKGIKDKDDSIIVVFEVGKTKIYCFVNQGRQYSEIKIVE